MSQSDTQTRNTERDTLLDSLPNFFIIGAAKAGTTSLYDLLRDHPQVQLPSVKEPHFFSNDLVFREGLDWFARTHYSEASGILARGDATPHYLFYEKAAVRISECLPESHHRFIVVLRNPVDRAYSLYWNMRYEGHESESFEDALRLESTRDFNTLAELGTIRQQYVESGLYAEQLKIWFRHFDPSRFLILLNEDLAADPEGVRIQLLEFLGVDASVARATTETPDRSNQASEPRSRLLQNFIRRPNRLRYWLGKLVPFHVKRALVTAVLKRNRRRFQYPPMSPETRTRLQHTFRSDIEALEQLIDRPLDSWVTEAPIDSATQV
jgi:hypothetical protein